MDPDALELRPSHVVAFKAELLLLDFGNFTLDANFMEPVSIQFACHASSCKILRTTAARPRYRSCGRQH